ncbi:hypothetical protein [Variovorax sp. N23]|uniref:hypothetical protein n=1 Tax=Variovorax sp. N23 TaxID=2980555 RepID=UPI0021C90C4A|nr:hypothetical protein [Variovorax sp. N23]MCU4119306.1 hypothetical protein [Variovorax sp. N23]
MANALSFAHLGGIGRGKASKAEEEEDKKDAKAEGGDDEPEKDDDDKKPAASEDDGEYAEDDKPDEKDDDKKSGKAKGKAESEDDDEDKDDEMRGSSASAKARVREQRRCAAIFASPAAARNPVLAANLAFKTRLTRTEALATLEATPAPASASHLSRAARNPNVGVDGTKQSPQQVAAARWDHNLQAAAKSGRR